VSTPPTNTLDRTRQLDWVEVASLRVSQLAQRDLNPHWVNKIVAEFDPEEFGTPTVNQRDGFWYVIDGQHRVEALRSLGWDDIKIECWVYTGLTEQQEAAKFLLLNNRLTVATFPRFRIGVEAGNEEETAITTIVQNAGLHVALDKAEGSINAVGTLRRIYKRDGELVLARTLAMIRDAYGTPGMRAAVLDGIALFCARYQTRLDDGMAVEKLAGVHGGVNGLLGRGEKLYQRIGGRRNHCVAAAAVSIYNSGKAGGSRLPSWWKGGDAE
jgi:hypothetical protein